MTTPDEENLLNLQERLYQPIEVAHIVQLERETIQKMCRDGRIEARKVGNIWRITKAEVIRFLREGPRDVKSDQS